MKIFVTRELLRFSYNQVSYRSLGKSVMLTTFRLGDSWLHENQLNHHKGDLFVLKLRTQGMISPRRTVM